MGSLEYLQWELRSRKKRWEEYRQILSVAWNGDRSWEGRTIGLHLPMSLRNFAVQVQEKLGLRSMKEVLFKALVIGLRHLDELPAVVPPSEPVIPKARVSCERCGEPREIDGPSDRLCVMCRSEDMRLLPEPTPKVHIPAPKVEPETCSSCGCSYDPVYHAMWCWTSGADPSKKICSACAEKSDVESDAA